MFLVAVTACIALALLLAALLTGVVALFCAPAVALLVAIRRRLGVGAGQLSSELTLAAPAGSAANHQLTGS